MIEPAVGDVLDNHLARVESLGGGLCRLFLNLRLDLHVSTWSRLVWRGDVARKQALQAERLEDV